MTRETRQIAYITNTSDRIFLSRAACIDLGMISETFPTIGEVIASDDAATPTHCPCTPRTAPPTLPEGLPMPATEENRAAIESWLKKRYAASTFKYMYPPNTAHDVGPTPATDDRQGCDTYRTTQSNTGSRALAGRGQGRLGRGCTSRRAREGTCRRSGHMVSPYGDLCQKEWQA